MYQHQHAPLPLEELEHVPQPVAALLGVLLEKDPAGRFQTPSELLKVMPTITDAIDLGRTITHQKRKYTSPYRDVIRAKIILLANEGLSNDLIASRLDTPRQIVSKWRKRFAFARKTLPLEATAAGLPWFVT